MKVRYEDFGSLVALDEPPALVQLDRDATLALGLPPSPRWQRPRGHFSAPTEVHVVSTVAAAARAGAREIEVLRYKPAGRARSDYKARAMTAAQRAGFAAVAFALADRFAELDIKLDCSLVPFLVATDPDPAIVQRFGVMGCEAGNMLAAVRGDGRPTACSFIERAAGTDAQALFGEAWDTSPELQRWRGFVNAAPEPCASCPWAAVCRGGCKVVSEHLTGERFAPDPECPRVEASAAGRPSVPVSSALADHPRLLAASPGGTT